jgi:hypothetical protein
MVKGQIVLLDTNVIIEAFRTRCWRAIVNTFKIETVEKCCEEAATGDKRQPGYVEVDVELPEKISGGSCSGSPGISGNSKPGSPSRIGLMPARNIYWRMLWAKLARGL